MADTPDQTSPQSTPPQTPVIDIEGARNAGFSDADILSAISKRAPDINIQGAQKAGFSDSDILKSIDERFGTMTATQDAPMAITEPGAYSRLTKGSYFVSGNGDVYQKGTALNGKDAFIKQGENPNDTNSPPPPDLPEGSASDLTSPLAAIKSPWIESGIDKTGLTAEQRQEIGQAKIPDIAKAVVGGLDVAGNLASLPFESAMRGLGATAGKVAKALGSSDQDAEKLARDVYGIGNAAAVAGGAEGEGAHAPAPGADVLHPAAGLAADTGANVEVNGRKVAPTVDLAQTVANVTGADTIDDAIKAAQTEVNKVPVDIEAEGMKAAEEAAPPVETGGETAPALENHPAGLENNEPAPHREFFSDLKDATIEPNDDGSYSLVNWDEGGAAHDVAKLKVWDENAPPETPDEDQGAVTTISPDLARAQREHYGKLGTKIVYFENDASVPFDGALDPNHPDTLFLSNDPTRNAAQVGAHEFTHALESTTLPDGTTLGDMLKEQVRAGITPAGMEHARRMFGQSAPARENFPEGEEGDQAHAQAFQDHVIRELGADIGGEAPAFATFMPKVIDRVQQKYGDTVAKSALKKFLASIKASLNTMRSFFGGAANTVSQNWVNNLSDIHDTLAQAYAQRYGSQLEKEQAKVAAMKQAAAKAKAAQQPEKFDDVASFLARQGGIRNDEGHDLVKGRGLQQFVPGHGPLIRPKGLGIDQAGQKLWEAGFFGHPDLMPNGPSEAETLELLEKTGRDIHGKATKVYRPDDQSAQSHQRESQRIEDQNAERDQAIQEIHSHAKALGEALTHDEAAQIHDRMLAHGMDAEDALVDHLERKAIQEENADHEATGDQAYEESAAFDRGKSEADSHGGEVGEGQASPREDEGGPHETGEPVAPDTAEAVELERGFRTTPGAIHTEHATEVANLEGEAARRAAKALAPADQSRTITPLKHGDGSWIIVDRSTGKAVAEIFKNDKAINRLNTEKYDAVPAGEYLSKLNDKIQFSPKKADEPQHIWINPEFDTPEFRKMVQSVHPDAKIMGRAPRRRSEPATEPGARDAKGRALPQTILPGFEHSAEQLAASREAQAHGRQTNGKPQKAADEGLFAEPKKSEPTLFSPKEESVFDWDHPGGGTRTKTIGGTEVTYGVGKNGTAELTLVRTKKGERNQGQARAAVEKFLREADERGIRVHLTADPMEPGVSKERLKGFYKSLGFKENRGRNADHSLMAGMIREPKSPLFSPKSAAQRETIENMDEGARDNVSGLIETATGGDHGAEVTGRLLSKITQKGIKQLKNLSALTFEAQRIFPRTIATLDDLSARFWNAWEKRTIEAHTLQEGLRSIVSDSLTNLPKESRDRTYAALELARKYDWRPPDDGRAIRVKNTAYWQARMSKPGDNFILSEPERKAFFDLLKLGDEGWKTFMGALAKREGWDGEPDPEAIRKAANENGPGLPEGKRLLRLADLLDHAKLAMQRPYFPAARFGDYYIAVKRKMGADTESTGGFPKVEWFSTVEKPVGRDLMGLARKSAAETDNVKEELARIKAMEKPDGSVAFPEDQYDFEIGDLRAKPNILRDLNIPAVEKLFMLMERGVTEKLKDKIIAAGSPDEGLNTRDAAQLKREAKADARERYKDLFGEAKDALLESIYHDLLAGWKKQANLVPGYSADFDRAIGSHIGHVSHNAADLIHRDGIEQSYKQLQDEHPHELVKNYWFEWRRYMENPRLNPLSRAFNTANRIGAVYVMGMNPATTLVIQSHTPLMATPVLGVGGGMGRAVLEMGRALRQVYGAITFDRKSGASIDTSRLGKTDREKALIADLDKKGLNHSIGADDVRAINDRQAGLWGKAAPTMRKGMQIATSNISVVDQANRNAIALATHRMAMDQKQLERMSQPWLEHNAVFREMVKDEGLTPENFARFMLSEAAGAWGKANQAPVMREEGALLFALHGFQTRFLSTALKLAKNMGPHGRVAASWMAAALWFAGGAYALPFTQDLENVADWTWKTLTGVDPMIDAHLRRFLEDAGLGKIGAEILMRGPLSTMLGVDLSSRIGFGNILTETMDAGQAIGTVPEIMLSRLRAAYMRTRSGQGAAAAGAELLPNALRQPARAILEKQQGVISQSGTTMVPADQVSLAHTLLRAAGLPPLSTSEAAARSDYVFRLRESQQEVHQITERAVANILVQANRASERGDDEEAQRLASKAAARIESYNKNHWQVPITGQGLNQAILAAVNPEIARKRGIAAGLRPEAEQNPYP